MTGYLNPENAL